MSIIGIDEAGRGPVIGPLVLCGVQLQDNLNDKLLEMGVKDSKQLTKKKREFLFDLIKSTVEKFHMVIITPEQLDEMMGKGINLNEIESNASVEIMQNLDADVAYIDCPSTNIQKYSDVLKAKLKKKIKIIAEHKADENYVSVGAASVLAKVTRDREIEKLHEEFGDFGSGYPSDPKTKAFVEKNSQKYPKLFRHYWEPWLREFNKKIQKRLGDF